jgi:two-component system OmpR family response regulator
METVETHKEELEDVIISKRDGYVFVVDDDIVFLTMLEEELKKFLPNAKVLSFKSGEACLENIQLNPFLILLDYNLAGEDRDSINGIRTLKEIKKLSPDTEVLMLSGIDDLKVVVSCMKYGAFDYIIKGENALSSVRSKIGHVVRKMRLHDDSVDKKQFNWFLKWITICAVLLASICYG